MKPQRASMASPRTRVTTERACRAIVACLLVLLARSAGLASDAAAARLPRPTEIARIEITHLPASISTRERLSLSRLHEIPGTMHLVIEEPHARASLARAISVAGIAPVRGSRIASSPYDARWSFVFIRTNGARVEIACDAFGKRGAIDTVPVRFKRLAVVLDRLVRVYPRLDSAPSKAPP